MENLIGGRQHLGPREPFPKDMGGMLEIMFALGVKPADQAAFMGLVDQLAKESEGKSLYTNDVAARWAEILEQGK